MQEKGDKQMSLFIQMYLCSDAVVTLYKPLVEGDEGLLQSSLKKKSLNSFLLSFPCSTNKMDIIGRRLSLETLMTRIFNPISDWAQRRERSCYFSSFDRGDGLSNSNFKPLLLYKLRLLIQTDPSDVLCDLNTWSQ